MYHLFGEKQCDELIKSYLPELRNIIEKHPEVIKPIDKDRDELDYTLILYFALAHALK